MHARHCCQLSLRQIALGPALSVRLMDSQIKGVKKARGVPLEILGGGIPPCSLNPDPISDQKCHFPYPFADLAFRQKLCHHYLDKSADKKINSSNPFHIRTFLFLSYSFTPPPKFPLKPYPIPDQNGQNLYPFSDQKGAKATPNNINTNKLYLYDKKYYSIAKAT